MGIGDLAGKHAAGSEREMAELQLGAARTTCEDVSLVTATRQAPGRPRQHESGAHRGAISEGHRSMQPVCSVHFCSDAPPLLAWHRPVEG